MISIHLVQEEVSVISENMARKAAAAPFLFPFV
jgi:hypothetical protein